MVKFFDKAKVDFIVKENEGVIIVKFSNPLDVVENFFNCIEVSDFGGWKNFEYMYNRISTVRGIAKCSPEDKFDVKIGKRIALNHLKKKTATSFSRYIVKLVKTKLNEYNKLVDITISNENYIMNLDQQLEKTYKMVESNN